MVGNDSGVKRKGETVHPGNCHQHQSVTFCSFFQPLIDFLGSTTGSMFGCKTHCTVHTHTGTYSQEVAVFSFLPSTLPPVPLSHNCILLLISWLHICLLVVFFSINKALIAFSLECDLAHCVLSFWGCWPWRTRLDYYTAAQSTGCYQTRALSQVPRSRHTAAKTQRRRCRTKTNANGPCNTQTPTHTNWLHGTMAEEKQCIFQVQTEEERRWTWGQSGRKVEIWGQIRPPASSQTW